MPTTLSRLSTLRILSEEIVKADVCHSIIPHGKSDIEWFKLPSVDGRWSKSWYNKQIRVLRSHCCVEKTVWCTYLQRIKMKFGICVFIRTEWSGDTLKCWEWTFPQREYCIRKRGVSQPGGPFDNCRFYKYKSNVCICAYYVHSKITMPIHLLKESNNNQCLPDYPRKDQNLSFTDMDLPPACSVY